jgi:hypothetical protein
MAHLLHFWVRVARCRLGGFVLHGRHHLEAQAVLAEAEVFRRDEAGKEDVDALAHRERHRHDAVRAWRPVQHADKVGEVVQHREVVLDDDDVSAANGRKAGQETLLVGR